MYLYRNHALWLTAVPGLALITLTTQTWVHILCFIVVIAAWVLTEKQENDTSQNHIKESERDENIQKKFDEVGRKLSTILEEETQNIHENMERIKKLIHEATEQLNSSFSIVATNTNNQKTKTLELGSELVQMNDPENTKSVTASLKLADSLMDSMSQQLEHISEKSGIADSHIIDTTQQLKDVTTLLNDIIALSEQSYLLVAASSQNEKKAKDLLDKLTSICNQAHDKIESSQSTVDETSRLVADINAVDINTFREEKAIIVGLLDNVENISQHTNEVVIGLAQTSESIGSEINKSIQAIQFEDIVNQLSSGMQFRLDHINEIGNTIFPHTTTPHTTTPHTIDYHLNYASNKLVEMRDEFHEKRIGERVSQESMEEGDIELF